MNEDINVIDCVEQEDGSAILSLELSDFAVQSLIQYAVNSVGKEMKSSTNSIQTEDQFVSLKVSGDCVQKFIEHAVVSLLKQKIAEDKSM